MIQGVNRPIEILLVEDSPDDVELIQESLKWTKMLHSLNVVGDGIEALAYLRKEQRFAGVTRPDLILLDLKLPKKDGYEVLREVKTDPLLKRIPIVVLTTSQDQQDVLRAYDYYASCYVTKPLDLNQLIEVAKWLENWLTVVKLPRE